MWKKSKIRDFATLITKGTTPTSVGCNFTDQGINFIKSESIGVGRNLDSSKFSHISAKTHEKLKRSQIHAGDILFSMAGVYLGKTGIAREIDIPANTNQAVAIIRLNHEKINPLYVYYYLNKQDVIQMINSSSSQSAQPNINLKQIGDIQIVYPDIEIQNRIVSILNALDEKIENNSLINKNLYEQAVAIFEDSFPGITRGKHTVGEFITPKRGKGLLSKDAVPGDVPVVAGGLEPSTYHNVGNTVAPVVTISASGANAGFVNLWQIPVWSSDSSFIDSTMTDCVFFWYVLLKNRQQEIFDAQTGSAQPHIYPQHISNLPLGDLDNSLIASYSQKVKSLFELIGHNLEENKRLSAVRDNLLPKLISGEIDVSDLSI